MPACSAVQVASRILGSAGLHDMVQSASITFWFSMTVENDACRDQLELLEDKLREYRALNTHQHDDKVVTTSVPAGLECKCLWHLLHTY
jgi:hypothetical protein